MRLIHLGDGDEVFTDHSESALGNQFRSLISLGYRPYDDVEKGEIWETLQDLHGAIRKHHSARGHDRCWENDRQLYIAAGMTTPGGHENPPIEEHRIECDRYRCSQYGTSLDDEPLAKLSVAEKRIKELESALKLVVEVDLTFLDWILIDRIRAARSVLDVPQKRE